MLYGLRECFEFFCKKINKYTKKDLLFSLLLMQLLLLLLLVVSLPKTNEKTLFTSK